MTTDTYYRHLLPYFAFRPLVFTPATATTAHAHPRPFVVRPQNKLRIVVRIHFQNWHKLQLFLSHAISSHENTA